MFWDVFTSSGFVKATPHLIDENYRKLGDEEMVLRLILH